MFMTGEPLPASEGELRQLALRFVACPSGVGTGGIARRVAAAVLGEPADLDDSSVAGLVPDAGPGLGENGFTLMLRGSGLDLCLGRLHGHPLSLVLQPACFAVPKDPAGNLRFEGARFLVAVSPRECVVLDLSGACRGTDLIRRQQDALGGNGYAVLPIPAEPAGAYRTHLVPLYSRRLEEVVPPDERPLSGFHSQTQRIVSHPGFRSEADMRRKCHVRELGCAVHGIRMFIVADRRDREDEADSVGWPCLWAMTGQSDASLKIVGGRMGVGMHVQPEWRGCGLGAELCLADHDDPVLRGRGSPHNRTVGSHKAWRAAHRLAVSRALQRGLHVPGEILGAYPDLAAAQCTTLTS